MIYGREEGVTSISLEAEMDGESDSATDGMATYGDVTVWEMGKCWDQ